MANPEIILLNKKEDVEEIDPVVEKPLDEDFDVESEDWTDWIEVSEYKKKIEDNFSSPEFEEAFAIDLGGAFKSRKDKLAWMAKIEEPKGKKKSAITNAELSQLWIIRDHLAQFNVE